MTPKLGKPRSPSNGKSPRGCLQREDRCGRYTLVYAHNPEHSKLMFSMSDMQAQCSIIASNQSLPYQLTQIVMSKVMQGRKSFSYVHTPFSSMCVMLFRDCIATFNAIVSLHVGG